MKLSSDSFSQVERESWQGTRGGWSGTSLTSSCSSWCWSWSSCRSKNIFGIFGFRCHSFLCTECNFTLLSECSVEITAAFSEAEKLLSSTWGAQRRGQQCFTCGSAGTWDSRQPSGELVPPESWQQSACTPYRKSAIKYNKRKWNQKFNSQQYLSLLTWTIKTD